MDSEHIHFLVTRSPDISEIELATMIANSSERFINANKVIHPDGLPSVVRICFASYGLRIVRLVTSWGVDFVLRLGK